MWCMTERVLVGGPQSVVVGIEIQEHIEGMHSHALGFVQKL